MAKRNKLSGVYVILNTCTNSAYIGSSYDMENRWSRHVKLLAKNGHHSPRLQRSWNKYGNEAFAFKILELAEIGNLLAREQYYLDTFKPSYNVCKTAGSVLGMQHSAATKAKCSVASKKMWEDPAHIEKIRPILSALARAQFSDPNQRHRVSMGLMGNKHFQGKQHTAETKAKMSAAMLGNKNASGFRHTPEARAKMSASKTGRNHPAFGKKPSAETRAKLSVAAKADWARRKAEREA